MAKLKLTQDNREQAVITNLYDNLQQRISASPPGLCPIDISAAFLKMSHAQTCGKCVPCRVGLGQLENLFELILDGKATEETIDTVEKTARGITETADCAIGYEAAKMVLNAVTGFKDDFLAHVQDGHCLAHIHLPVPCVALCPANVDVPGYVALVGKGNYEDAVELIRKDNPFPTACALVCEHPCENRCRRNMTDSSINIRGLKRFAVDHASKSKPKENQEETGKRIAIIGGGPSGLTAAFYLQQMGHQTEIFEQYEKLGGMLRYGIPSYRLPRERLEEDIDFILSTGAKVHLNTAVNEPGSDVTLKKLQDDFDAIYIAIGAHSDRKIGIEGEEGPGVISAIEMLKDVENGNPPDFTGKTVMVIGGGNVAMDATRTSIRLGADKVGIVYRRRKDDMTALVEEIDGAVAEGAQLMELYAPLKIERDENDQVKGLWVEPKIIGKIGRDGRPAPGDSDQEPLLIDCDIIITAIGQVINSDSFSTDGLPLKWGELVTDDFGNVLGFENIYAGGDCVSGPATVIRAVAAGKAAARNIDKYLGFNHIIDTDVDIPQAFLGDRPAMGRVTMKERSSMDRVHDFEEVESGMTLKEAVQEASRCLRCDHFGYGNIAGGRIEQW